MPKAARPRTLGARLFGSWPRRAATGAVSLATVLGSYGGITQGIAQVDATYARADSMRRQLDGIRTIAAREREQRQAMEAAMRERLATLESEVKALRRERRR